MSGPVTCTVSYRDMAGMVHAVDVSASSLYEAMALALVEFRRARLADCEPGPMTEFDVQVRPPAESHRVRVRQLEAWLSSGARSPAEQVVKVRLRELLGK